MTYTCNLCIKQYSSYQSLWIHNKKFHTIINNNVNENVKVVNENVKVVNENVKVVHKNVKSLHLFH